MKLTLTKKDLSKALGLVTNKSLYQGSEYIADTELCIH